MQASIEIDRRAEVQYVLRLADTGLILGQRLAEWCGHAPVLEEDIAMANMALDLIGQARALLSHAGALEGRGHDEDQLAFLRDERDVLNLTIAELPNSGAGSAGRRDFAFAVLRNAFVSLWLLLHWQRLERSNDAELAAIAGKAVKEARYHWQHASDWLVRLADGTAESRRRIDAALAFAWRYVAEFFDADAVDAAASASGLGPSCAELRDDWFAAIGAVFEEGGLTVPDASAFRSHGRRGRHTEHMGYLLAEMQHLQRAFPGGVW